MEPWDVDRATTRRSCVSVQVQDGRPGAAGVPPQIGQRSAQWPRSWASARRRRCASGSARPRSTAARGLASPAGIGGDQAAGAGERRAAPGERDPEGGLGFLRGGARPPTAARDQLHRRPHREPRSGSSRSAACCPQPACRSPRAPTTPPRPPTVGPGRPRCGLRAGSSGSTRTTSASTGRVRCGGAATARRSRWPAAPW